VSRPAGAVSRPAGDPAALGAGARALGGAAQALRGVGDRLRGAASFVVVAGAWRGPASEAFLVDDQAARHALERAAGALDQAAGAVAELAARLGHAQATWDQAARLAAAAGLTLGQDGAAPVPATLGLDPAAAGQAARLAAAAVDEAAAARRTAAARLDQLPQPAGGAGGHGRAVAVSPGARGGAGGHGGAGGPGGRQEDGAGRSGWRRVAGEALEVGHQVVTGAGHLLAGAEARLQAAARVAVTGSDPSARMAATRVLETAALAPLAGAAAVTLPLAGSAVDLAAGLAEGEPLPRALARAVGGAVGADAGARVGMAACGGQAAATEGAGLVVCPAVTVVTGAVGAELGRRAAVRLYDELVGPPEPEPVSEAPG
jgi:uncharacterized protein YukE